LSGYSKTGLLSFFRKFGKNLVSIRYTGNQQGRDKSISYQTNDNSFNLQQPILLLNLCRLWENGSCAPLIIIINIT